MNWRDEFGPVVCAPADDDDDTDCFDDDEDPFEAHPAYADLHEASRRAAGGEVDEALIWLERALNQIDGLHFGGFDTIIRRHFAK